MNGIQRVSQAIRHAAGAPIARGELVLEPQFARNFIAWYADGNQPAMHDDIDLQLACCRALGLDLTCLSSMAFEGKDSPPVEPGEVVKRIADEGLFVFWLVDGVFQRAAQQVGMMALLTKIGQSPETVPADFKRISGQVAASIDLGVSAGAHGIIIADDIAYHQNTFISPACVEHNLLPLWQTQVAQAAGANLPIFFHADGNLNAVLPLIKAAGFDGLQGIEAAAGMDMGALKKQYGGKLCLMGGLSPSLLCAPKATDPGENDKPSLRRDVSALIDSASGDGGFIFGTSSGLHAGMSPERVQRAYRLSFKQEAVCVADGKATDC
jgi:uroporphyrinogen decarboxylase